MKQFEAIRAREYYVPVPSLTEYQIQDLPGWYENNRYFECLIRWLTYGFYAE